MNALPTLLVLLATICSGFAAPPAAKAPAGKPTAVRPPANMRTISNLTGLPRETLRRLISPKFYKSLLLSPVEGYIVARGHLINGRFEGARIVHSELGGAYDAMALNLPSHFTISGVGHMDRQLAAIPAHQYLLIYKIADGTMAVSFPAIGESGGNQGFYYGSAFLGVRDKSGKWNEIKGPEIRRRR